MSNIIKKAAFVLAALVLGTGVAAADASLDPMRALSGRPAGTNPLDPMTAIRAKADAAEAGAGNEELGGLPGGAGAEETYYQCVACHSADIIKQQRVTDHRWDELWTWMVEAQGMAEPDEETRQVILTYLKQHFSSER